MRRHFLAAGLCLALLPAGCGDRQGGEDDLQLVSPYRVDIEPFSSESIDARCAPMPAQPLKDMEFNGIYKKSDPHRAEIDEESRKEYLEETKGLRKFENELIDLANRYIKSDGHDYIAAYCGMKWLHEWASADAFLGHANAQGAFLRQWSLAVLSSAYLQLEAGWADAADKDTIETWLRTVADKVMADNSGLSGAVKKRNNHMYWAAWGVTATGIALNDRDLYDWGVNRLKYAIHVQIEKDGYLPLEMNRGKKALQYHVFALTPLILTAEAAYRNGEDLYEANDGALHALVRRTFEGMKDSSWFEKKSGFKQESSNEMSNEHFAWMEIYNARFPDPEMTSWLTAHRPVMSRRAGGDITYLFTQSDGSSGPAVKTVP